MANEIERKFKVKALDVLKGLTGAHLTQGYIPPSAAVVRAVVDAHTAWLMFEVSGDNGYEQKFKYAVPPSDAESFQSLKTAVTVRIRVTAEQAWLTIKGPATNGSRVELEYDIPLPDAQALLALAGVTSLSKTRYCIPHEGFVYELDEYHGDLSGLFSVEVELPSIDEPINLPDWVGDEVTGVRAWDNDMLARAGRPEAV